MRRRIVIVDDNRDHVATVGEFLRVHGHEISSCYTGTEALNCVQAFDPDVVLLDKQLPGRHGWDIAKDIRDVYPGKRPLIIGYTAEVPKRLGPLTDIKGLDYCVSKTVDLTVLLDLISKAWPSHPA